MSERRSDDEILIFGLVEDFIHHISVYRKDIQDAIVSLIYLRIKKGKIKDNKEKEVGKDVTI